jgi:hypothetical protein
LDAQYRYKGILETCQDNAERSLLEDFCVTGIYEVTSWILQVEVHIKVKDTFECVEITGLYSAEVPYPYK